MKNIINCAICNQELYDYFDRIVDYSVSGDVFLLKLCKTCGLLHTSPLPLEKDLQNYYPFTDYISHRAKPTNLFQRMYFYIRNLMISKKINLIKRFSDNCNNILDYGCGTGQFLARCKNEGWVVSGFEPNINAGKVAENLINARIFANNEDLAHSIKSKFDVITLWHVIEHVYELNETMGMFYNILSNNGILVLAIPNYNSYDAKFFKESWAAFDVPRHLYHFDENAVKRLGEKHGFVLEKIKPLIFDSFFISLLSQKNNSPIIKYIRAIFVGMASNLKAYFGNYPYSSQVYILRRAGD